MISRRGLVSGLIGLVAAPSIVRAGSLMCVTGDIYRIWHYSLPMLPDIRAGGPLGWDAPGWLGPNGRPYRGTWTFFGKAHNIYTDQEIAFSKAEYPA